MALTVNPQNVLLPTKENSSQSKQIEPKKQSSEPVSGKPESTGPDSTARDNVSLSRTHSSAKIDSTAALENEDVEAVLQKTLKSILGNPSRSLETQPGSSKEAATRLLDNS